MSWKISAYRWNVSTLWHQPCENIPGLSTEAQQHVWEVGNAFWAEQLTPIFLWCRQGTGLCDAERRHSSLSREWALFPREEGLLRPWWQFHCANFVVVVLFIAVLKNKTPVGKMSIPLTQVLEASRRPCINSWSLDRHLYVQDCMFRNSSFNTNGTNHENWAPPKRELKRVMPAASIRACTAGSLEFCSRLQPCPTASALCRDKRLLLT